MTVKCNALRDFVAFLCKSRGLNHQPEKKMHDITNNFNIDEKRWSIANCKKLTQVIIH